MKIISRWIVIVILVTFAVLFLNKGLDLWSLSTTIDGDGIGIYFLGFELNDKVSEGSIPVYAIGFFISSFVFIIISAAFVRQSIK